MKKTMLAPCIAALFAMMSCTESEEMNAKLPKACFEAPSVTAKVGDQVEFTNCSENAIHFAWDFGDGTTSTEQEPVHVFQQQGNYTIKLIAGTDINADAVFDIQDEPDSTSIQIEIAPR